MFLSIILQSDIIDVQLFIIVELYMKLYMNFLSRLYMKFFKSRYEFFAI